MATYIPSDEVAAIRARLDHPVIDGDGHLIEYLPVVRDFVSEEAGPSVAAKFEQLVSSGRLTQMVPPEQRRELGMIRSPWWGIPSANTLDRATAMLPDLQYRRLDELGIDVAFLYPTYGLTPIHIGDEELRRASARAFNRYVAEAYGPYSDRLLAVACIPTYTPAEAVEELRYCVKTLGLKAAMLGGAVVRPIPGNQGPAARWVDGLGHGSPYDYDPLWQACVELGISPTFHSTSAGWGSRTSPTNFTFNHVGSFAMAGELTARSLLFGGVPLRFPQLRFAFLEGGPAWGMNLHSDLHGHFAKRNMRALAHYDPAALDRGALETLFTEHARGLVRDRIDRLGEGLSMLSEPVLDGNEMDDFAESGITTHEQIRDVFSHQYFFGCEADDPMAAVAFDESLNPYGARIGAFFASDIGHWDVPDFRNVLPEAWELVEDGHLDEAGFKAFTFDNAVRLWCGTNPQIFDATPIAGYVPPVSVG